MSVLGRDAILFAMERGDIKISPFDEENLNPNSYNLTLAPVLKVYDLKQSEDHLLVTHDIPTIDIEMTCEGYVLRPGMLYLGSTIEYTETHGIKPSIDGRSSLGRLGLSIHRTAGFGDHGFCGTWTLEMDVLLPLRVYPGMQIAQISYQRVEGPGKPYQGRYQNQHGPTESRLWQDYN